MSHFHPLLQQCYCPLSFLSPYKKKETMNKKGKDGIKNNCLYFTLENANHGKKMDYKYVISISYKVKVGSC